MTIDELAENLVGQPWWEWMPGMVDTDGFIRAHEKDGSDSWVVLDVPGYSYFASAEENRGAIPGLTEPGTYGWLLKMLTDALGGDAYKLTAPGICAGGSWRVEWGTTSSVLAPTLGEAITKALIEVKSSKVYQ